MAWFDPRTYVDLFELMWREKSSWYDSGNATSLAENMTSRCPGLVGGNDESQVGENGFASLRAALAESCQDEDQLAARIRQLALSRPATEYGFGAEWARCYITEDAQGGKVYATTQFAEPEEWQPVPVGRGETATAAATPGGLAHDPDTGLLYDAQQWYLPDGVTVVTRDPVHPGRFEDAAGTVYVHGVPWQPPAEPADPAVPVYDEEAGRWRRLDPESGGREFYDDDAQVWERRDRFGLWNRLHEATGQWLPYDSASGTWLYEGEWRAGDLLGAEQPPTTDDALTAQLAAERLTALQAATAEIRDEGIGPDELSDEEISELFDAQVLTVLESRSE